MAQNEPQLQPVGLPSEDHMINEIQDNSGEELFPLLPSGRDEEYSVHTPEQKPSLHSLQKVVSHEDISELSLSTCNESSELSTKEGPEIMSSSSSSSDAESGTYELPSKKYLHRHVSCDGILEPKIDSEIDSFSMKENLQMGHVLGGENMCKEMKGVTYEELLEKVASYELELKFAKKRHESSQEEIARLKYENLTLVEELGRTIEKLRTSEDHVENVENQLRNDFEESQHLLQSQLDLANRELASERELVRQLQETIKKSTSDLSDNDHEIYELKLALCDAQEDFSKDRSQLESDIINLQRQNDALDARLKEAEQTNQKLVEQIQHFEARETGLLDEIRQLDTALSDRCQLIDSLNQSVDGSNLKYDLLMAEKDVVFAKMQTIGAELRCKDDNIRQMEECISQLVMDNKELLLASQKTEKLAEELKLKVIDQEREIYNLTTVLCERAEEKREAIRQLCHSLEYYRSGYHEFRQVLIKHKKPAILAS